MLVGDSCYDEYHFGRVNRISPEAPIPVFDFSHKSIKYGMASNVYENLKKLGADVHLITAFLETKKRFIDEKSGQQLLRVDEKNKRDLDFETADDIFTHDLDSYDAIVVSDYDKGFLTYSAIEMLRKEYSGPIFIDTKKTDLKAFEGCFVKINEVEYLKSKTKNKDLIVTYGAEKVLWNGFEFRPPKVEAYDVCGAGDTFLAALAYKYVETGNDMKTAIQFAMRAAAVTVQKIGVYAPTLKEIGND
jgi:bifunctional ADP-heptose synthase (sugar kinase/adenylyltransferase)